METPKLEPCPFCGSPDVRIVRALSPRSRSVYCGQCEAEGPHGESGEKAVKLWNTRKPSPDAPAGVNNDTEA